MSTPRTVVESFMKAFTEHRWESAEALLADDFLFAGPVPQPIPKPAFLAVEKAIHAAMDDWDYDLRIADESGEVVKTTVRITAKHVRTLTLPMPHLSPLRARGVAIALPEEVTTFTVKNGKITRIDVAPTPGGGVPGLLAQIATNEAPGGDTKPFVLYAHPVSGTSYKAALALSLAGEPFELRTIELMMGVHYQPAFVAKNRFHQVPVLEHRGQTIVQSNVILEYIAETLGKLHGTTPEARWRVKEWLAWEADHLIPGVALTWSLKTMPGMIFRDEPVLHEFTAARGARALEALDAALAKSPFLAGDAVTIADISCYAYADRYAMTGASLEKLPNLRAWTSRIEALPGYATRAKLFEVRAS